MGCCQCFDRKINIKNDQIDYKESLMSDTEDFDENPLTSKNNRNNVITDNEKNNKISLILYDFDQTITSIHLYHELHGGEVDELNKISNERLIEIFGGLSRIESLNEHFKLLTSNNIKLGVLSFGFEAVIQTALQRMNLLDYFSLIIGRDSYSLQQAGGNKANCIEQLAIKNSYNKSQIFFVDDDSINIASAMKKNIPSMVIQPRKGMTQSHMKQIENSCI